MITDSLENKKIIKCPSCGDIPLIQLSKGTDNLRIQLKCSCSYDKSFDLDKFLLNLKTIQNSSELNLNEFCFFHKKEHRTFFCKECGIPLCLKCKEIHSNHVLLKLEKFIGNRQESFYQNIIDGIENSEKHINKYVFEMKEKLINKLKNEIDILNRSYCLYKKNNDQILSMMKILTDNYFYLNKSSSTFININNLSQFHLQPCNFSENDITMSLINLKTYLKKHLIINLKEVSIFQKDDLSKLELIQTIKAHDDWIRNLILLKDGRLASCSDDKTIKIFNLINYKCDLTISVHSAAVYFISQLDNGKLISCSGDKTIKIGNISNNIYQCEATLVGHREWVVKVIPISKNRIVSCSYDKKIGVWNSEPPYDLIIALNIHRGYVNSIIQIKNEEILVSASWDSTLKFWNLNDYSIIGEVKGVTANSNNSLYQIDSKHIIIGEKENKNITIVNFKTYQIVAVINNEILHKNPKYEWYGVGAFLKLNSSNSLLCGCPKGSMYTLDLVTYESRGRKDKSHENFISSIIYLGQGNIFATAAYGKNIKIWKY
ncbi:MAG: hypothetical protein MJ252_12310, partial [archaeon]|nr:hypothetical protein [archaeon]